MLVASTAKKVGTGKLREDAEPLLKRFALLGEPRSVKWMSGTMGDSQVPGPSTYWIDAIVRLQSEQAALLRRQYALKAGAAAEVPELEPALREFLPDLHERRRPGTRGDGPIAPAARRASRCACEQGPREQKTPMLFTAIPS